MSDFLDHLAAAIAIPTVANDDPTLIDHEAFGRFGAFLADTYPATWADTEQERFATHSIMLTWRGTDPSLPPVVLTAHFDVVPVEDPTDWDCPPFEPTRTTSHLVGRGAIDDKGSLIAILEAVESLIRRRSSLRRTLILALGHDEEMGGVQGAGTMAQALSDRGVRAELILDEGGFITEGVVPGTRRPVALVGVAEKGYLDVEISADAEPGHSSAPPRVTAVGAVASAIARLQASPMPANLAVQTEFFEAVADAAPRFVQPLFRSVPRLGPVAERLLARRPSTDALIRTTTAPTVIEGGIKANVLPASARALVNFRLLPGDSPEDVLAHIRKAVGDTVQVRSLGGWGATPVTSTDAPGYAAVHDTIRGVFPDAVIAPWIVIGATDARFYSAVSDVVLRFLPFHMTQDELTGFHGTNERIRLTDAGPAVRFYQTLIETVCR